MEFPELSLASTYGVNMNKNSNGFLLEYSEANASRKRKLFQDHHLLLKTHEPTLQASVDLQLKDPLPLDWEQCLDLESGKMYYLNRKTLRKSWNWPIPTEQTGALDLELNMSTFSDDHGGSDLMKKQNSSAAGNNNSNMVALACRNCHLLVILSKSSPSCPNCKYVHSLPTHQNSYIASPPPKVAALKSLNTLSLLN